MATTIDSILETQKSVPLANQFFDVVTRHDGYTSTYDGHHYYAIKVNNGEYAVVEQTWSDAKNAFVDADTPIIIYDGSELTFLDRDLRNVYQRYAYTHDAKVTSSNVDYFVAAAFKSFADHRFANTAYDVFVEGEDKVLDNLSSVASSDATNSGQPASSNSSQPSSAPSASGSNNQQPSSTPSTSDTNNSGNPASSGSQQPSSAPASSGSNSGSNSPASSGSQQPSSNPASSGSNSGSNTPAS